MKITISRSDAIDLIHQLNVLLSLSKEEFDTLTLDLTGYHQLIMKKLTPDSEKEGFE